MDFKNLVRDEGDDFILTPFAGKTKEGDWVEGTISINYLNVNFGHLETAEGMINATESEGLKLYFQYLKEKGILA